MIELLIDHQPRSIGSLKHFPEKLSPVFRQKMRPLKERERFPVQSNWKALERSGRNP
jgi:hypothetical protein